MEKAALISVYDKSGVVEIAEFLSGKGYRILSTGSTARYLKMNGVEIIKVEDYTLYKEILDGRVKTLHPKIHGGILFKRDNSEHRKIVEELGIFSIDVVIVNLYPFESIALTSDDNDKLIENIDIGGPTLLRSAAKNYEHVLVVCDPSDYSLIMRDFDKMDENLRKKYALKAFAKTSYYDGVIVEKMSIDFELNVESSRSFKIVKKLRYGENPHQKAFFAKDPLIEGLSDLIQLNGKELSYNNILDLDVAYRIMLEFEPSTCVIIKHSTPCGVATSSSILEAYQGALDCDPVSAFGGVIGINTTVDRDLSEKIVQRFYEVVVAFDYEDSALEILKSKRNLRVIKVPKVPLEFSELRSVVGGYLIQESDYDKSFDYEIVSQRSPTKRQLKDLEFAFRVAKFVRSNAIVYAKNQKTLAIGGGQTSRIDSAKFASIKAKSLGIDLENCVMASDGFFPFRDSVDLAHSLGVGAIVEPGGSIRDSEVIEAANEYNIALVFTHVRHFRH